MTAPDWIRPGAPVVLYTSGSRSGHPHAVRTTVKRVAAQSFVVDDGDHEQRFRFDRMSVRMSVRQDPPWDWTRHAAHPGSAEAVRALAEEAAYRAESTAISAVDEWRRDRTRENRRAAISALEALDWYDTPGASS